MIGNLLITVASALTMRIGREGTTKVNHEFARRNESSNPDSATRRQPHPRRASLQVILPFPLSSYRASASSPDAEEEAGTAPEEEGTEQTMGSSAVVSHSERMPSRAGFLERSPKRGCGGRIEPQEGEYAMMRERSTARTPRWPRRPMGTRDHLEQEPSAQEVAPARGFGG